MCAGELARHDRDDVERLKRLSKTIAAMVPEAKTAKVWFG
jgi:hypothetical protein